MMFIKQPTGGAVKEIRVVVKHAHLLPTGDWHTLEAEAVRDVGGGEDWKGVTTQLTQEVRQQVEAYFSHFRQQRNNNNGNGRKGREEHPVTAFWRYVYDHDIPQSRARAVVDRCGGDFRRALAEIRAKAKQTPDIFPDSAPLE